MEFQPMSHEEMERTMQFLLRQQAQFAADYAKLSVKTDQVTSAVAGLTGKTDRMADGLTTLAEGLVSLTGIVDRISDNVGLLTAAQRETDRQLKETDRQLKETDRQLKETIRLFERHLREDHGRRLS